MVIPRFEAGYLRVTHPFATFRLKRIQTLTFDLHVLGTPPAFILSQDQTLRIYCSYCFTELLLHHALLLCPDPARQALPGSICATIRTSCAFLLYLVTPDHPKTLSGSGHGQMD
jgi:hypothetical protein